jgi:hypothetical protein
MMKSKKESNVQFFTDMDNYLEIIKKDYVSFLTPISEYRQEMIDIFNANIRYEVGSKYIKVITENSVHSFIVRNKTDKFKPGDILKAASWKAPAKNFARGNIFDKTFDRIRWTGAN